MPDDEVAIRITLRNAAKFVRDARSSSDSIRDIGNSSRVAGVGLAAISTSSKAAGAGLRSVATEARYAVFGVGALAAAGAKWGIDFNAGVESSSVALKTLLGSQEAANRELKAGQDLAKSSSILNFRDTAKAQQMLIGTGVQAQLTRQLLEGTADAMVALGRDPEEFQQVIRAFGQIQSKGRLMGDEVTQQLGEVFPAMRILRDELGLTEDQVANLGGANIDATTALTALAHGMKREFGGAAEDAEHTWVALMSRLKDDSHQALGAVTKDTFDWAEKAVLPAADRAAAAITAIFGTEGLSNEEKIRRAGQVIERELSPVWDDVADAIGEADIPERLGEAVKAATPFVLDAMADIAPKAAKAFVDGWMASGPEAQVITALFLGNKLRKSDLGKALGGLTGGGKGGGVAGALGTRGATPANPVFVAVVGGGVPDSPVTPSKRSPKVPNAVKTGAKTAGALTVVGSALYELNDFVTGTVAPYVDRKFVTEDRGPGPAIAPPGFGNQGMQRKTTIEMDGREFARVYETYSQIESGRRAASVAARR